MEHAKPDVVVVGGGPIGLASAWRAAQRGLRVCVLDAGEPGAWHVAAGMLAAVAEAQFGEDALLELSLRAAAGYPELCAELAEASGVDPGLHATGTLVVARDRDEAEALDRLLAFRRRLGLDVERLLPSAARRAEPALAPTVRLALDVAGDHSVDPRRLVPALAEAVRRAGGRVRARARVTELMLDGERVTGVRLSDGGTLAAGSVLVAAGAHAALLEGLPSGAAVPVRPVKGQVLRLRDPQGPGLIARTIRTSDGYIVPRADGRYVLGATMEERGFDTAATAGGVFELLRDVSEVLPGVLELELEELLAGLRPATPDNVPAIGAGALERLFWAIGHHRNGILLSGLTGELAAAALCGEELPDWAAPADPRRFAGVPA
ncbi:MAG TPA: glycine oxidase ThiO [Solirubrobacteraceae bacterium]|nr:glycine oxidase ThiO [Solirubrobacteraceae bacterium]